MDNRVLFRDGPLRITCSGCGKEFYAEEIRRCRACGGYFCRECQKTHDCRIDPAERSLVPSFLSSTAPVKSDRTAGLDNPVPENSPAQLPAVRSEKVPYKNTGMILSEDEAYIAYVREVNPFIKCESCGEEYPRSDIWVCPDCGAVLCQICRQKHKCPKPEGEQNKLLALLPFTKDKKTAAVKSAAPALKSADADSGNVPAKIPTKPAVKMLTCDHCGKAYPISKLRKCKSCGAVLCPKCRLIHSCSPKSESEKTKPAKPAAPKKKEPVKKAAAESAEAKPASPKKSSAPKKDWDELIICDSCGEPYLKSKMRKCHSCGAVLCPKCRRKHTCGEKKE